MVLPPARKVNPKTPGGLCSSRLTPAAARGNPGAAAAASVAASLAGVAPAAAAAAGADWSSLGRFCCWSVPWLLHSTETTTAAESMQQATHVYIRQLINQSESASEVETAATQQACAASKVGAAASKAHVLLLAMQRSCTFQSYYNSLHSTCRCRTHRLNFGCMQPAVVRPSPHTPSSPCVRLPCWYGSLPLLLLLLVLSSCCCRVLSVLLALLLLAVGCWVGAE